MCITASGNVCIGHGVSATDAINTTFIAMLTLRAASSAGVNPLQLRRLQMANSAIRNCLSQRFKETSSRSIKPVKRFYALKPVSFRYKGVIQADTPQFGLIAEEVEKMNPDLVYRDKDGKPLSVRYDLVNAMLLNEFLKEHRKSRNRSYE